MKIHRRGQIVQSLHVNHPPSPTRLSPLATPTSKPIPFSFALTAPLLDSWATLNLRLSQSSLRQTPIVTNDDSFTLDDGSVEGIGRKRLRFSAGSRRWRVLRGEDDTEPVNRDPFRVDHKDETPMVEDYASGLSNPEEDAVLPSSPIAATLNTHTTDSTLGKTNDDALSSSDPHLPEPGRHVPALSPPLEMTPPLLPAIALSLETNTSLVSSSDYFTARLTNAPGSPRLDPVSSPGLPLVSPFPSSIAMPFDQDSANLTQTTSSVQNLPAVMSRQQSPARETAQTTHNVQDLESLSTSEQHNSPFSARRSPVVHTAYDNERHTDPSAISGEASQDDELFESIIDMGQSTFGPVFQHELVSSEPAHASDSSNRSDNLLTAGQITDAREESERVLQSTTDGPNTNDATSASATHDGHKSDNEPAEIRSDRDESPAEIKGVKVTVPQPDARHPVDRILDSEGPVTAIPINQTQPEVVAHGQSSSVADAESGKGAAQLDKAAKAKAKRARQKANRKKRTSAVPDALKAWFSAGAQTSDKVGSHLAEPTTAAPESTDAKQPIKEPSNITGEATSSTSEASNLVSLDAAAGNVQRDAHMSIDDDTSTSAHGFTSSQAYYTPLSMIEQYLNQSNAFDVFGVVTSPTSKAERSKTGAKDYHTTFHMVDRTSAPIQVQCFRHHSTVLPHASAGDIVVLHNIEVKSRARVPYLISNKKSAWCVWRISRLPKAEGKGHALHLTAKALKSIEECRGAPIELGPKDYEHAVSLAQWRVRQGDGSDGKDTPDNHLPTNGS